MLVEDPEEVEKHAKKLEYSSKSPKKLARLSKKENFFVKVLKQRLKQKKLLTKLARLSKKLKKPSSN